MSATRHDWVSNDHKCYFEVLSLRELVRTGTSVHYQNHFSHECQQQSDIKIPLLPWTDKSCAIGVFRVTRKTCAGVEKGPWCGSSRIQNLSSKAESDCWTDDGWDSKQTDLLLDLPLEATVTLLLDCELRQVWRHGHLQEDPQSVRKGV